jgi:hypothetical protein
MKESIQHKLDEMERLAQASKGRFSLTEKKSSVQVQDSLAKAIKTKEEADRFLAELDFVIKQAQRK